MGQFEITFAANELPDETVDEIHRGYTVSTETQYGLTMITVEVDGDTLLTAAQTVVYNLERVAGVHIDRCCENLVDITDIADRTGVPEHVVAQWIQEGHIQTDAPFPPPHHLVAGGVWLWSSVNDWLRAAGENADAAQFPGYLDVLRINEWLASRSPLTIG